MQAEIDRIVWQGAEGWTVLAMTVDGSEKMAVGYLTGDIKPGCTVDLTGEWTIHPKFGRQFRISTIVALAPSTTAGIEKWLASGAIGNVGQVMARRICQHFGTNTPEIVNKTPERIIEVPGIGKKRVQGLIEGLQGNQATRLLIEWLGPHGISMGMINKLIRAFDSPDRALQASKMDPYRTLAKAELPFKTTDKIAMADGMPHDDQRRMNAVAVHSVLESMKAGHCYVTEVALLASMGKYLNFPVTDIKWLDPNYLHVEEWGIYLQDVRNQERWTSDWLEGAVKELPLLPRDAGVEQAVRLAFNEVEVEPSEMQFQAVLQVANHRACVITGGPGTGKTTIVQAIVHLAENYKKSVRLLAPTGRAQLKLGQVCNREASTIHKALMCPLDDVDITVVDEMSMVDIELMSRLTGELGNTRLVMVGDYHQLPSVGPGNVLKDVIDSGIVPVVRLDTIFRQAEKSEIILNAHRIIAGRKVEGGGDCWLDFMEPWKDEEASKYGQRVEVRIVQVVADILSEKFNPLTEIQVLLPMYRHHPSIDAINEMLQHRLNPMTDKKQYLTWGRLQFRVGDKVMQTKNNYDLDVFNGEIGIVIGACDSPKKLMVDYPGYRVAEYDAETIPQLKLAYAVSIHKSQGSEYPCVVVGLSQSHFIMLQRNLIYTALTRAKSQCTIVGDRRAVEMAINNDKPIYRNTRLLR